jgi:hypothetical protein
MTLISYNTNIFYSGGCMDIDINDGLANAIFEQLSKGYESLTRIGFLFGERGQDKISVKGVLVPEQNAKATGTEVGGDAIAEVVLKRVRENSVVDIVGIAFYHPLSGPPFESNIERLSRRAQFDYDYSGNTGFSMVFNSKGEYRNFME